MIKRSEASAGRVGPGGEIPEPNICEGSHQPATRRQDRIETSGFRAHDPLGLDTGLAAVSESSEPWVYKLVVGKSPPDPTSTGASFSMFHQAVLKTS